MKNKVVTELKRIAEENGGLLQPETVVDEARPESSPLHSRFEWDDGVAGENYRIWQARQLIRVVVEVISATGEKENVFVSLTSDRRKNGYRVMTEVLSDADMRQKMLADALTELELFRDKYKRLRELAVIFSAIRKVKKKK